MGHPAKRKTRNEKRGTKNPTLRKRRSGWSTRHPAIPTPSRKKQIPHRRSPKVGGRVRDDSERQRQKTKTKSRFLPDRHGGQAAGRRCAPKGKAPRSRTEHGAPRKAKNEERKTPPFANVPQDGAPGIRRCRSHRGKSRSLTAVRQKRATGFGMTALKGRRKPATRNRFKQQRGAFRRA